MLDPSKDRFSVVKMYNGLGGHGGWADEVLRSDAARVRGFLSGPGPVPGMARVSGGSTVGSVLGTYVRDVPPNPKPRIAYAERRVKPLARLLRVCRA